MWLKLSLRKKVGNYTLSKEKYYTKWRHAAMFQFSRHGSALTL